MHWLNHLLPPFLQNANGPRDVYLTPGKFEDLQKLIANRLDDGGYRREAREIRESTSEDEMNERIILQYTRDDLFPAVNFLLRDGPAGQSVGGHPLAPWILQLNAALRFLPEYRSLTYRGAHFSRDVLDQYHVGMQFIWPSFTSSSRIEAAARDFSTNVLFELHPLCHPTMWDKRAGRLISRLSAATDEEEVLLPLCCAFQIVSRHSEGTFERIRLNVMSYYPIPAPGEGMMIPVKPTHWFEK
jgi:hypothetical protein